MFSYANRGILRSFVRRGPFDEINRKGTNHKKAHVV